MAFDTCKGGWPHTPDPAKRWTLIEGHSASANPRLSLDSPCERNRHL